MLGSVWLPLNTSTVRRLRNIDGNLERLALTRRSGNDYTATGGFEEEVGNDRNDPKRGRIAQSPEPPWCQKCHVLNTTSFYLEQRTNMLNVSLMLPK